MPRQPMPRHDGEQFAQRVAGDAPPGDLDAQARLWVIFDTGLGRRLTHAEVVEWLQERERARARRERPPHPLVAAARAASTRCSRFAERLSERLPRPPDIVLNALPWAAVVVVVLAFRALLFIVPALLVLLALSPAIEWLFGIDMSVLWDSKWPAPPTK